MLREDELCVNCSVRADVLALALACLGSGRRAGGELEFAWSWELLGSGRELERGAGTRKRELDSN